jgi:transcription antitermination factor NusB
MKEDIEQPQVEYNDGDIICDDLAYRDQRALIFHLLYAIDAFDYETSLESIADYFGKYYGIIIPTTSRVFEETLAIVNQREKLDTLIKPFLANWRFERLGTVTRLILRLGIWELTYSNTDPIVIIYEAVELAQCFAEKGAYTFVNAVLDGFTKRTRTT